MIDGILLIDKEKGITSYDVIRRVKKDYPQGTKIGHAGTLDPFATGLIILMIGRSATKLMDSFHKLTKRYVVEAQLGFETDTQDITGNIVMKYDKERRPGIDDVRNLINKEFLGSIEQLPPKFSAKKIKGKKAYDLARKGVDFELKSRIVNIHSCEILEYEYPTLKLDVRCSTGTYIRTLVKDLGLRLGTYATAKELRRLEIGPFSVEYAGSSIIEIDKVKELINNEQR